LKKIVADFDLGEDGRAYVLEDGEVCFERIGEEDVRWDPQKARRFAKCIFRALKAEKSQQSEIVCGQCKMVDCPSLAEGAGPSDCFYYEP
jgi:hypothetical protein